MRLPTLDELEGNTGEVDALDLEDMAQDEADRIAAEYPEARASVSVNRKGK